MAFITREYFKLLDKNKLIEHGDWINLERMSRQAGMKNGNGVSSQTFRNAVVKGLTTTDEVVTLVEAYFAPKFDTVKAKRLAIKELRRKLQSA